MDLLKTIKSSFSETYSEARSKFVNTAHKKGLKLTVYENPNLGPLGENLTCDVAWAGSINAEKALIIISGTHGVEGFCGSGCQVDWLECWNPSFISEKTAVFFIHAINPHGFAWCRRVTEEGCDLNRNFLDFNQPLPDNIGHDELVSAFVPDSLDAKSMSQAEQLIKDYRETHGELAFQKARKSGQYKHAHSMFFGGFEPTWARKTLERIITDFNIQNKKFIAAIDFHTGLGPFGYGEPISMHKPNTKSGEWVSKVYGDSVGIPEQGTSFSIPLNGTSRDLWDRVLGENYAYVALEYGTYSQERSRAALREDHWLHNQGTVDWSCPETKRIKKALKKHYYPATPDWLEMVVYRSRQVLRQASYAINSES